MIKEAKLEAERILKNANITAREDLYKRKEIFEKETQESRQELRHLEKRLSKREDNLERKIDILTKRRNTLKVWLLIYQTKKENLERKNYSLKTLFRKGKIHFLKFQG